MGLKLRGQRGTWSHSDGVARRCETGQSEESDRYFGSPNERQFPSAAGVGLHPLFTDSAAFVSGAS